MTPRKLGWQLANTFCGEGGRYGTPNTKIFKTQKYYSRSNIYIQHLQNVFNFFLNIFNIFIYYSIFSKYIQELRSWIWQKKCEYEKKNSWIWNTKVLDYEKEILENEKKPWIYGKKSFNIKKKFFNMNFPLFFSIYETKILEYIWKQILEYKFQDSRHLELNSFCKCCI